MENNSNRSSYFSTIWLTILTMLTMLVMVFIVLAAKAVKNNPILYELVQPKPQEVVETVCDTVDLVPLTVEEAVSAFKDEALNEMYYRKYVKLHPVIVEAIFKKIGTTATLEQIMKEYETNKSFYLSLQAANEIKEVKMNGPDADRIKLTLSAEVDTTVKEKTVKVEPEFNSLQN